MLACYPRRQQVDTSNLPSPTPHHLNFFNNLASSTSPTQFTNDKHIRNYLNQQPSSLPNPSRQEYADQFMTSSYDFPHPSIRIQQSTPGSQLPATYSTNNLMMDNGPNTLSWDTFGNNGQLTAGTSSLRASALNNNHRSHQRSPSSSTNASNVSASAYNPAFHYYSNSEQHPSTPQTAKVESSYNTDDLSSAFSNHLPTPSHTPTQDTFNGSSYSNFNNIHNQTNDGGMAAHMAMKQALMDQQHHQTGNDGSCPDFGHSSRQSVSSYGADSPATPHNTQDDCFNNDDRFKVPSNGEKSYPRVENWIDEYLQFPCGSDTARPVPKLDRTMTDIYADELFNPNVMVPAPAKQSAQPSNHTALLSPFRNVMNDRLQAAHQARSQSPSSSMSRAVSPFRQGSPLAPPNNVSPQIRLASAQQLREQQKAESDAYALQQSQRRPDMSEPKTISPKDALLDYHESEEDAKMPLFPDANGSDYDHAYTSGDQTHYDGSSEVSYGSTATSQGGNWSGPASTTNFPSVSGPSPPQTNFSFQPPSVPNVMHGLNFSSNNPQYRSVTSMPSSGPDDNPQFHPQLTSMDSSASEMPESSQTSNDDNNGGPVQRPSNSGADTGTYTCTYHGCTLRFETPQKLQKHKRDGHRPHVPSPGVGSGMTSAQLLARNSQAGPHKCERVNPTTGKPCNTIFSRPYDLTRHEDTIHNARKQKVRCALCVEEKTFSRNDALTRHMRVVHPEVDFPGKHRRRGGGSSYE